MNNWMNECMSETKRKNTMSECVSKWMNEAIINDQPVKERLNWLNVFESEWIGKSQTEKNEWKNEGVCKWMSGSVCEWKKSEWMREWVGVYKWKIHSFNKKG